MNIRVALERFIRQVTRERIYLRTYECSVERQHDDDTLDLLPDDEAIRGTGLARIPIRHGLPGVRVRILQGSRVLLGFAQGDPTKPYASLWEPGAIESLHFDGGDKPIARVGDTATVFWPPSVPITGSVLIGGVPSALSGAVLTITSPSVAIIETGASKAKA